MGFFKSLAAPPERKLTTVSEPSDWLARNGYESLASFGGYSSHAGAYISEMSSLDHSAWYACAKIISEDMGTMPFFVNEHSEDGLSTSRAKGHRLWPTLRGMVNPEVGVGECVECLTSHAAVTGNGFARIEDYGGGIYLWPWQPSDVQIRRDSKKRIVYIHKDGNAAAKTYERDQVFHLRGYTMDCESGDKVVHRARHALGLALTAQEYASKFFKNDVFAGLILEHPGLLGKDGIELTKKAFIKGRQGAENAGEPIVFQEGMKANRVDPDMEKLQLLDLRKFQVIEACRYFRMPPHKLADLEHATFSNIEHQQIQYVQDALNPWGRRWREAVFRCLLTRQEQLALRIYAEHSFEALLKGDFKAQTAGFRAMLEKGVYSINEVRRWLNLNPVEGGDQHHIQMNMRDVTETAGELSSQLLLELRELKELSEGQQDTLHYLEARLAA